MKLDHVIRTSQRKQDALSPSQQRRIAEDFERRTGHEIVFTHDSGRSESGKTMDRAALHLLRERVQTGQTDGAFLSYLDRLGRAPIEESMGFVRGLVELDGGNLFAADWSDDAIDLTRPDVEDMLVFRLQMNRSMWNKAAARQRDNKRDSLAAGKFIGPTPFGYRKERGRLVPDPLTGPIVTEAFRRAARSGFDAARDYLLEAAPDARIWRTDMVRKVLESRTYLGEHATRGLVAGVDPATGEPIPYKAHTALTNAKTFNLAQHAPRARRGNGDYLLTGRVFCECGAPLIGQTQTYKDRSYTERRRYRCAAGHTTCDAAGLDELVRSEIAETLEGNVLRDRLMPAGVADAHERVERAIAELSAYQTATSALGDGFAEGAAMRQAEVAAAQAELAALDDAADHAELLDAAGALTDAKLQRTLGVLASRYGLTLALRRGRGDLTARVVWLDEGEVVTGPLAA